MAATQALVVRCHDPTPGALRRIAAWCNEAAECGVDLWVSIDVTTHSSARRRQCGGKRKRGKHDEAPDARGPARRVVSGLAELGVARTAYGLHTYDEADMIAAYPALRGLAACARLRASAEFEKKTHSLAWGFHCEGLNLWFRKRRRYAFVWAFEDDVGFAGPLSAFFARFADDTTSDLITADAQHRPGRLWWWADARTDAYAERYPRDRDRLASREHAQRFSRALLCRLHDLSRAGVTAWSEALAVTVCAGEADLVLSALPADVLGSPFSPDGRVGEAAWGDILAGSARKRGRLYHALKF